MHFELDDAFVVNALGSHEMKPRSPIERIALLALAAFASISTFAVMVLAPMAASGGLA